MSAPRFPRALALLAPSSGAGKTFATLALLRALRDRGHAVAGAKSGPDYIDPRFHEAASGRPSANLDAWAMSPDALRARALEAAGPADLLLIEGAMGALDGAPPAGRGAAAELAETLGAPALLILDIAKLAQSAALPVAGLLALRPRLRLAGVILNRAGSPRHADMTARALAPLGVPVLGALPRLADLEIPSRHLGLVQAEEHPALEAFMARAGRIAAENLDLDAVAAAAAPLRAPLTALHRLPPPGARVALARDAAFAFAYPHLLADWRAQGAEILPFSPLADQAPDPSADAVFLPGGYPELHAARLAAAATFGDGMRRAAAKGARIHGECGGYMVLGETLEDADGQTHPMLGLLPLATSFARRRMHLGYRRLRPLPGAPWEGPLVGHEFHYASILSEGAAERLYATEDAEGASLGPTGLRAGRVSGGFAHVIGPAPD